jgi:chromosome partition protein MukF
LRDVVRLDPDRALSQRLRDQVAAWTSRPFHLLVAHGQSIRLLRQFEARVERPTVTRPRADREAAPEWVDAESLLADIDALVITAIQGGAKTLAEVTSKILPALPDSARYAAAGRVAEAVARLKTVCVSRERPWMRVSESLEIEDWRISGGSESP